MNNQNQINSLYELIKQKSQEKGRPLKVIADWDETLMSLRPLLLHRIGNLSSPFDDPDYSTIPEHLHNYSYDEEPSEKPWEVVRVNGLVMPKECELSEPKGN